MTPIQSRRAAHWPALLSLLLAGALLIGCSGPAPAAPPAPSPSQLVARAEQALTDFVAAARRGDAAGAAALVSDRDPAFAARAAVWAANLAAIDWSSLTWTVRGPSAPVPEERRATLGDAWVQQVTISWSLAGESRRAENDLWLTFVEETEDGESATLLAGDSDSPAARAAIPIWLQQPVRVQRAGAVLVLSGTADGADAADWLARASAARSAVAGRIGEADRDPDGVLVVEVPQSRAVFERVLGVAAGSYAGIGAAAWPMASDSGAAPIHVVINPEATRQLSGLGRDVLLTHEAVHVATRSPGSPAPTWLVEGYADQIAYAAHPRGSEPATAAVRGAVRADGVPAAWPSEDDFAVGARTLELSYHLAWSAVRSIAAAEGAGTLNRLYAAVDRGDSLDRAAGTIGSGEATLRQRWRTDLERLGGR